MMAGSPRFFTSLLGGAILLLAAFMSPVNAQSIIEYAIPTANALPGAMTLGSDGALWFVEGGCPTYYCAPMPSSFGKIGRITTDGVITEYVFSDPTPEGITTGGITAGPDGALWFTVNGLCSLYGGGTCPISDGTCYQPTPAACAYIGRITTSGVVTDLYPVAYEQSADLIAGGITAGPDGALWFGTILPQPDVPGPSSIGRITTAGGITTYQFPEIDYEYAPVTITSGPDGALWFTTFNSFRPWDEPGQIDRITTTGVATTQYSFPAGGNAGSPVNWGGITTGPDGALWFTENACSTSGECGQIGRLTTAGVVTAEYPTPSGTVPGSIMSGPNQALWFTAGTAIGQITTGGAITEYPIPGSSASAQGITIGPNGSIWFTDSGNNAIGTFAPVNLTVSVNGIGVVTSNPTGLDCTAIQPCAAPFAFNSSITLTASAISGSIFSGWSGGGCSGTTSTCVVHMTANTTTVSATFVTPDFTLSVSKVGDGRVKSSPGDGIDCGPSCIATFASGTKIRLHAIPASGWKFDEWRGACTGKNEDDCHVTMSAAESVIAKFKEE